MKITTWNVNGIRAAMGKGLVQWVGESGSDVICLQEIKAKEDQIDLTALEVTGYRGVFNPAERPGYSGTAALYKTQPAMIKKGMGFSEFDSEGRLIQLTYPDFELFNIYFPNGGEGNKRVPYKLEFYATLLSVCQKLMAEGKEIIITGDFNTAHKEIDLKNPKQNEKNTGFLPEEREWIDRFIDNGFTDIYRRLYPEEIQYTWWTYRFNARSKDIGWRLDYYLITPGLVKLVKDVIIHSEVMGSDHCPVTLWLV